MLISRVEDEMAAEGRREGEAGDGLEYQTASELFDLMAQGHPFQDVSETLSTSDLVILYKNIDLGTKLMANAEEYKLTRKPNQRVETVVYNDEPDSEGSEASEVCGDEELRDVFMINKERLDLLNGGPSLPNTLCQKLGDLEIQTSNLSLQYDQHFLFKDPYIKEQLKNMSQVDGDFAGSALPASLLDYICCKRLEDNYNFYMDNIIRYVKHTIEQLKRISNGDYLTDKAKEKWREVEDVGTHDGEAKVLAASTSIPLQVERKINGLNTTWDDIIHSEVDVRSLSKILEKKIVVEVPKLICGSYKLFSKFCSDNVVISCKKEPQPQECPQRPMESRVDVVLQLGRSDTGQVVSNISSIMILQPTPPALPVECPKVLPLPYKEDSDDKIEKKTVKIVEIPEIREEYDENTINENSDVNDYDDDDDRIDNVSPALDTEEDLDYLNESKNSIIESSDSSVALKDILDTRAIPDVLRKEAPYDFISPDDLSLSMHKMNMSSLPEENCEDLIPVNRKKSPSKVRIKSPYENKSHMIEEKKRKKLLEIREKREKKKMAIGENCKITKHRYGKGAIMPQASSSVTKLSITNKSFYNSIYGQNLNVDKQYRDTKNKGRRGKRDLSLDAPLDQLEGELETPPLTPETNNKKYVNRSYYLDEAVTEMMYTDVNKSECSSAREMLSVGSASAASADFSANINVISQIINSPDTDGNMQYNFPRNNGDGFVSENDYHVLPKKIHEESIKPITSSKSMLEVPVPLNSPNEEDDDTKDIKKTLPSVECRKSIDKLYDLMKNIRKMDTMLVRPSKSKLFKFDSRGGQENSTVHGSDSGTSLKHHLTSSNPSSFSFDKVHSTEEHATKKHTSTKTTNALTTVIPKVIISTKQQSVKNEAKKDRKRVALNPLPKINDNPLKAISQLLHEFDSVQKLRHKPTADPKVSRKPNSPGEGRITPRPGSLKRRSRVDQTGREGRETETRGRDQRGGEMSDAKHARFIFAKDRRPKANSSAEPRGPQQAMAGDERVARRRAAELLDEAREAKGEAVRGPRPGARLQSLAQPRRAYVQALGDEQQRHRPPAPRPAPPARFAPPAAPARSAPPAPPAPRPAHPARARARPDPAPAPAQRPPPPVQPLERAGRVWRATSTEAPHPAPAAPAHKVDAPDTMKNKMVTVETYVNSHYGCASPSSELVHTRVPLVPNDLEVASASSSPSGEESVAIGNKLHYMISMMGPKPAPLAALLEAREPGSRASLASTPRARTHPASSLDSDYRADIFEDKHVTTAVQQFDRTHDPDEIDSKSETKLYVDSCDSSMELQKLEEAFHRRVVGTFQKRLRIKNLTLTPKHSMQQMMVLESGDAGSVTISNTLSRNLKISASHSDIAIKSLASLGSARVDWRVSNIPMQVTTVGYAFPEYNAAVGGPSLPIKSLENVFRLGISVSSLSNSVKRAALKTTNFYKSVSQSHLKLETQEKKPGSGETTKVDPPAPVPPTQKQITTVSVATDAYVNHVVEKNWQECKQLPEMNKSPGEVEPLPILAHESVDCTSSLDMLVGLLNEIQKITTCHMTSTELYANEQECNELAALLNNGAALQGPMKNKDSRKLVSITSLDNLRQLESSPSIYSLYLSNDEKDSVVMNTVDQPKHSTSVKSVLCDKKPECVDKQVSADFPVREIADTFTDVPSKFFPVTITHSTNVTNSLIGILSKPSSQTVVSFPNYNILDSAFSCEKKIIEITDPIKPIEIFQKPAIECSEMIKVNKKCKVVKKVVPVKVRKVVTEMNLFGDESKGVSRELEPALRIKRDVLVTVYSLLVLTVFAALSFPDLVYHY